MVDTSIWYQERKIINGVIKENKKALQGLDRELGILNVNENGLCCDFRTEQRKIQNDIYRIQGDIALLQEALDTDLLNHETHIMRRISDIREGRALVNNSFETLHELEDLLKKINRVKSLIEEK